MARLPRYVLVGQPQHVIVRGNNREPIFYAEDDYRFYLETLKKACAKHQCDVHAYVLTNQWGQTRLILKVGSFKLR